MVLGAHVVNLISSTFPGTCATHRYNKCQEGSSLMNRAHAMDEFCHQFYYDNIIIVIIVVTNRGIGVSLKRRKRDLDNGKLTTAHNWVQPTHITHECIVVHIINIYIHTFM